ncbi:TetR/AcrR family transcriptional regulator [Actinomadura sp. 6N118]|uniref:TetR/AcrR family transcriptional regulator n=1 Tax=Actinomadura sp. 6N118 TaxID=3375151 RepID=UPI0037B8D55C
MASRRDWLDAGLAILAERGAPALTIERLTGRLGLTKGSFYHHFKGMGGYKTALLAHFEAESTTLFIELTEADPHAPALTRLQRLLDLVVDKDDYGPELEVAVRAWAQQDAEARELQERVDRTRVDYLRALWQELTGDPDEAVRVANLFYMITIGAEHVIPPLEKADLRCLFEHTLRLAAGDRAADPSQEDAP